MKPNKYGYVLVLIVMISLLSLNKIVAQESESIFSISNRLAFGNHLFCEKDYLRAISEYDAVLSSTWSDTIQFKIASAYFRMKQFDEAYKQFEKVGIGSSIHEQSEFEKYRILFALEKYNELQRFVENIKKNNIGLLKLNNSTMLLRDVQLPKEELFISPFEELQKTKVIDFYRWKNNPPYKNSTTAALLSAIIPGLGKVYADEIGDGITSFIFTGLFSYLAINKFQNNHTTSGILYASIATFFYAGNIYGSVSAVQNFNAGLQFNFEKEVKIFINENNQFLPTPKYLCD